MRKGTRQIVDYQIKGIPLKITKFTDYTEKVISPPHFHDYEIEFQFIIDGNGFYFIKDKKYEIEKRKVLIIHRKDLHYFIPPEKETKINKITVMMKKKIVFDSLKFFPSIFKCRKNHQIFLKESDFLVSQILLDEILENIGKKGNLEFLKFLIKLNLSKFLFILQKNFKSSSIKEKQILDYRIDMAIKFINENYGEKIKEDEICRKIGISKYHFSHLFKKDTGLSFKNYLIEKRLFESAKLLRETSLKIEKISQKCGFSNFSLFFREFKKKFNLTPSQYRKIVK